jgi:glutamine synthetase
LPADLLADSGKLKVAVSGIDGILRGKYLHRDKFLGAAQPFPEGGGFCDVVFGWMRDPYTFVTILQWAH